MSCRDAGGREGVGMEVEGKGEWQLVLAQGAVLL